MKDVFNLDKLLQIFNYVFWFFILNLFFMLFNIPMVSFFMFVGISKITTYLPLFLLCLIPVGPSLTILLYCMGKIIRNKDLNILSDFIKGFKLNFKQSTLIWCCELLLIFMLYSNIKFFSTFNASIVLTCLFVALLIVLLLVTPYLFILISRFSMSTVAVIKSSFILAITRPVLTITNVIIFLFTLVIFEIVPGTVALFISSILCYLLVFANKSLLEELETAS